MTRFNDIIMKDIMQAKGGLIFGIACSYIDGANVNW